MKISRNDPCPCGSGRKYKKCHLGRPLDREGEDEAREGPRRLDRRIPILAVLGVGATVLAGVLKDASAAVIVALAWTLASVGYLVVSRPPPPKEKPGNPAALDFGMRNDS